MASKVALLLTLTLSLLATAGLPACGAGIEGNADVGLEDGLGRTDKGAAEAGSEVEPRDQQSDRRSDALTTGDGVGDAGGDGPCVPKCEGRECGWDNCGGSCGECVAAQEICTEGQCLCEPGKHPGGAGDCVPEGECAPAFGINSGETQCLPLAEVCLSANLCQKAESWAGGSCKFVDVQDGQPCEPQASGPCAVGSACFAGLCEEVWAPCAAVRPVILVHGINGSSENFAVMKQRLIDDGWPPEYIFSFDAADPSWGCNLDNATAIQSLVKQAMDATCQSRVDVIAHSMGTLSSRYFIKNLGGAELVNTYVTLGGMHHGMLSSCFAPDLLGVCVWQEICQWGDFVTQLNEPPATPGPCNWVSICSTGDETVKADSSFLEGAENIQFSGVPHDGATGLLEDPAVYAEVLRVLKYPCW